MGKKSTAKLKGLSFLRKALFNSKVKKRPIFLSHLITTRCNCSCPMCLWRDNNPDLEMSTVEVLNFYRDSAREGFVSTGIWGGEPLLRNDLEEILRGAHRAGLTTVLLTNGYYLEERLEELSSWLDSVVLSLDYPGEEHDRMRGCPGLYQRVTRSVELLRSRHPHIKILVNCLLHRGNERHIPALADLVKEMGVSFYVCPVKAEELPGEGGRSVEGWEAEGEDEKEAVRLLLRLKKEGYPLNNSYTYLQEFLGQKKPFTCYLPLVALLVRPDGEVVNCLEPANPPGNVRKQSVGQILRGAAYRKMRLGARECQHCNNPNVVETSYLWELRREPLINALSVLSRR